MPPATRKSPKAAAKPVPEPEGGQHEDGVYLWDELVADSKVSEVTPFRLKVSDDEYIEIPCPNGDSYLRFQRAAMLQDSNGVFEAILPVQLDPPEGWEPELNPDGSPRPWIDSKGLERRARVRQLFRGADFPIYDTLGARVIAHYFSGALPDPR